MKDPTDSFSIDFIGVPKMSQYASILRNLEAKRVRQEQALKETTEHISVIQKLEESEKTPNPPRERGK